MFASRILFLYITRVYGPGVYVRTDITLSQHSDIQTKLSTAFGLLVKYIKGANEGNVEIPMTAPGKTFPVIPPC